MRLVAQHHVQAELAPHEEKSRRQECLNFDGSRQLIIFLGAENGKKMAVIPHNLSVGFLFLSSTPQLLTHSLSSSLLLSGIIHLQ